MVVSRGPRKIQRGEVWNVNFDPQVGQEIQKIRPAVVVSVPSAGRLPLHIVVPITTGNPNFKNYFWMVAIPSAKTNGLSNDSFADAFQIKSVSIDRFVDKRGVLTQAQLNEIAAAIALCVGYTPLK